MKPANKVLSGYGTTVFEVMSRLAAEHGAVNLGQGFPDRDGPADILERASEALIRGPNQYPPMLGLPDLRRAVAEHNKHFYDIDVDWQTQVLITSGATEALADCLFALIEPGDEVILIEPLYDSYLPIVRRAGGIPRLVRLEPPDWRLPEADLRAAFSERTKLLLLNNPHNPAAKVFSEAELSLLAELVIAHDAYALCDEVYEHIVFDGHRHRPLMTFPGMTERCLRIGSAGKSFSLTGWKVGYVTAPAALLGPVMKAHQFITFTTPPNLQEAVAFGLRKDDAYFAELSAEMQTKRDRISAGLVAAGFSLLDCKGTYFVTADFTPLGFKGTDEEFCAFITREARVTAVPVSAFYPNDAANNFIRFCFCKEDEVLDEATDRLQRFFAA